jgi:hypothetical protein
MNQKQSKTVGILLAFSGFLVVLHHLFLTGRFFDLKDILHHEFFEAILFTAGLTLLLVSWSSKE